MNDLQPSSALSTYRTLHPFDGTPLQPDDWVVRKCGNAWIVMACVVTFGFLTLVGLFLMFGSEEHFKAEELEADRLIGLLMVLGSVAGCAAYFYFIFFAQPIEIVVGRSGLWIKRAKCGIIPWHEIAAAETFTMWMRFCPYATLGVNLAAGAFDRLQVQRGIFTKLNAGLESQRCDLIVLTFCLDRTNQELKQEIDRRLQTAAVQPSTPSSPPMVLNFGPQTLAPQSLGPQSMPPIPQWPAWNRAGTPPPPLPPSTPPPLPPFTRDNPPPDRRSPSDLLYLENPDPNCFTNRLLKAKYKAQGSPDVSPPGEESSPKQS